MWFQSITLLIRIRPSIAWYHVILCVRWNWNLDILLPIRDSSWNIRQQISWQRLSQINASPYGLLACILDLIGDQPILCQRRTRPVSLYRIRVWRCNAYKLKPMSRVASGLLSSASVKTPSVTSCLGRDCSLWPESTIITLIACGNKLWVPLTHIFTINCCVCVSE